MIAELVTNAEIAAALGVHVRTVQGYASRGMPRGSIDEALSWVDENIANNGPPTIAERAAGLKVRDIPSDELDEAEQRARIEKLREEARQKQLKNDIIESKLLDADEVELNVAELTGMVRNRLEAVADKVSQEMPQEVREKVRELVAHEVFLVLTEMSQWRAGE